MSSERSNQDNKKISLFSEDNFENSLDMATKICQSAMIPKCYIGKPIDILIAMEMGNNVGLSMMQSLYNIAVINGKPSIYGDAVIAVAQSHPDYEWIKEEPILKGNEIIGYRCNVKRKNHDEHIVVFTIEDAKKAGLWGKTGPWSQYPSRMLQLRARGFALRNMFADALQGIQLVEESEDIHIIKSDTNIRQSQKDKLNLLLEQKGIKNEKMDPIESTILHNDNSNAVHRGESIHVVNHVSSDETKETNENYRMVGDGEENKRLDSQETSSHKANEEQLDAIDCLIHEKNFKPERVHNAFKHFNVRSFADMSKSQADEMIKILNKE